MFCSSDAELQCRHVFTLIITVLVGIQKYMAMWIAKLAAAEKDFRDSLAQMEKAGGVNLAAQGGQWYLEAIDRLALHSEDGGERAMRHIRDQLQEIDKCANS